MTKFFFFFFFFLSCPLFVLLFSIILLVSFRSGIFREKSYLTHFPTQLIKTSDTSKVEKFFWKVKCGSAECFCALISALHVSHCNG
jgi:hypothetical protein